MIIMKCVFQVCVPVGREWCLNGGCVPWGECRELLSGKLVGPPQLPTPPTCWPNQATLSNSCARITLLIDRTKLGTRTGVSIEGLCTDIRLLLAAHQAANDLQDHLVVLCDLKTGANDTIEVTVVSYFISMLSLHNVIFKIHYSQNTWACHVQFI